jgi:hypothetical protein
MIAGALTNGVGRNGPQRDYWATGAPPCMIHVRPAQIRGAFTTCHTLRVLDAVTWAQAFFAVDDASRSRHAGASVLSLTRRPGVPAAKPVQVHLADGRTTACDRCCARRLPSQCNASYRLYHLSKHSGNAMAAVYLTVLNRQSCSRA